MSKTLISTVIAACGIWLMVLASQRSSQFLRLFTPRPDCIGSPHGTLPPGAEARSPNGRWTARLTGSTVELFDRDGNPLGAITSGHNDPKALAWSPDSERIAVLFHDAGETNTVQIIRADTRQVEQVYTVSGPCISATKGRPRR